MTSACRLPGRPESVTAARRFARQALDGQHPEIVEAAELMVSELATNSIRHAHTGFELTIHCKDEIRVEVRDTAGGQPVLRFPTPAQPSGRGLQIVEAMSEAWGVIPSDGGKTVWFALAGKPLVVGEQGAKAPGRRGRTGDGATTDRRLLGLIWEPSAGPWRRAGAPA
jgi:anti-sigma regulatory factor (Ser/Thr protein kinase)